ncbi:YkgJ family cysteine cluster protein [Sulfuritalea sp.]|uniref:YkgJ family cysteine cluster protein n=1 Tax=Sulfuritalea sp. TaxID=2480090 RepID=UPI00286E3360|nr:YkgJ family cysteine cluster protein [Sulfuritalea sp.]
MTKSIAIQKIDFTCTKCGECCKNLDKNRVFMLFPVDIPKLTKALNISREDLISRYIEKSLIETKEGNYLEVYFVKPAANGHCPFLKEDNLCGVQEHKPEQCIRTPFGIAWSENRNSLYECLKEANIPEEYSTVNVDKELFETLRDGYSA